MGLGPERGGEVTVRQFDVLVTSHGDVAAAMIEAAAMICGPQGGARAVALRPEDSPESFSERLAAAIDDERPTLILTDLFGGTPHNVACAFARRRNVWCIAGANLGMVIEALTTGDRLDEDLVGRLVDAAREGVVDVAERLSLSP